MLKTMYINIREKFMVMASDKLFSDRITRSVLGNTKASPFLHGPHKFRPYKKIGLRISV